MRRSLVLVVLVGLLLTAATGCGFSETSISGQVVLNGEGTDDCTVYIVANGKFYFGDTLTSDGRFSHSKSGYDAEFCVPGCVVSLGFVSEAPGACGETAIRDYVVVSGSNNLGPIEIGTKGLALVEPTESAAPSSWPVTFSWSPSSRTDLSDMTYSLLLCRADSLGGFITYWSSPAASGTTCALTGSETSMDEITHWTIDAQSTWKGLHLEQVVAPRSIALPVASGS